MTATKTPAVTSLVPPLNNPSRIISLVAELTGATTDAVTDTFRAESQSLGVTVARDCQRTGVKPYVWNRQMECFYEETDAFLYETTVWNASTLKQEIRDWVGQFLRQHLPENARILTFGDGLGFDSAYLAQLQFDVDYFEVSPRCIAFAQSVFAENEVNVSVVSDGESLPTDHYDAVVCLDVLEHVPDPPGLVQSFARWLKPGGHLIASAPFFFVCPSRPTHLRSNLQYAGDWKRLYGTSGFEPVDGRTFWDPIALRLNDPQSTDRAAGLWTQLRLALSATILRGGRWSPGIYSQVTEWIAQPDPSWMDAVGEDVN